MTPKEQRIEQLKNKIAESKKQKEALSDIPPAILFLLGSFMVIGAIIYNIPFLYLGVMPLGGGLGWSSQVTGERKKLEDAIFSYEGELYNIEKEP